MTVQTTTYAPLPEAEHSAQLRKAVVASTNPNTPVTAALIGSLGYQLASVIAGGPAPIIATALLAAYHSVWPMAIYIAICAAISLVSAAMMPDFTGRDISSDAYRKVRA